MWDTLTHPFMCGIFSQTRVQQREGKTHHCQRNLLWYHIKVYEPYSLSKDALKDEGYPWLINSTRQWSLSNMEHFNTYRNNLHVYHPLVDTINETITFLLHVRPRPTLSAFS
jgi:hypothetical protein